MIMGELGLDYLSIDQIAEQFVEDSDLVLTIVLLQRLHRLALMDEEAPEAIDNFLAALMDRLYRFTEHWVFG